jgi:membrane fusion protein, macrolide-specific efflux system
MRASIIVRTVSAFAAALLLTVTTGCQYILPKEEDPLPPPLVQPKGVDYVTATVTRGDIVQSVRGVGRVESAKMVDLYFEAGGGRLKSINVKYGDIVKKGDVLLELDTGNLDYDLAIAKLRYQVQQNRYNADKSHMSKTDRQNALIELQISQMDITQKEKQIADGKIVSPIDGEIVYRITANQGSGVDAYTTLIRVADTSIKMLSYEDDANKNSFKLGMKVQVTLNKGGAATEGEVVSTPFERDKFDTEKLASMIFIKVPDDFLAKSLIGDEASLLVVLSERKNILKLPRNAVKTYLSRRYVDALVDGVKMERDVQVGLETITDTEILSGLEEGDKVIIR